VCDGQISNKLKTFTKISIPELVASGESFEGSLVDDGALLEGGFCPSDEVAPP